MTLIILECLRESKKFGAKLCLLYIIPMGCLEWGEPVIVTKDIRFGSIQRLRSRELSQRARTQVAPNSPSFEVEVP